jgi:hypothetical protein
MKVYFYYLILIFQVLFLICGCENKETELPKLECKQPNFIVNRTVAEVKTSANAIVAQYKFDDIIEAYVISSDESGNYFKTLYFQTLATDTSPAVGFSVPVDATNLFTDYRIGNKVYIKLNNQFTDILFGGLRIGSITVNSFNDGGVGRLSQNEYKNVLNASCTSISEEKLVKKLSIKELLNEEHLNTLVELSDVQFTSEANGRNYYEPSNDIGGATNWNLQDKLGNQVIFRTSSFSDFAKNVVPSGSGKVRGILTKFATDYQLVARSEKDVSMTGTRATPFFAEDFETVVNNVKISLPGWTNIAQKGSKHWIGTVFSGNGFAEFNTTGTKVISNVAWLISPKIDMDAHTNEILTFRAAQHDLDLDTPLNSIEVYISSDFTGLNVATATWLPLSAILPKQATPKFEFVGSGGIDLSGFKGKVNIAFKYTGSGKNLTLDGAFQVDDVQIYGD